MPKIYQNHQKRKWLELFEKGKSEKWIANYTKCDYRTVKKGIQEARQERNAIAAQIELVKEALSDHKDQLLTVLDEILLMIVMPPDNMVIRPERNGSIAPIPLTRATVRIKEDGTPWLDVPLEAEVAWELLHEHFKGDKVWRYYREWKEAVLDHIQARLDLRLVIARAIREKTSLEISHQISENEKTDGINPETVEIFQEVITYRALNKPDGTNLEKRMVATGDGYVRNGLGGTTLVHATAREEQCRKGLLSALEALFNYPEVENVKLSYNKLQDVTSKTRRTIEEIALMRILLGTCRVCNRLGIK